MEINSKTFLYGDRNEKIAEAIRVGYSKEYITKCVYEQQNMREPENRLGKAESKQLVYKIAYDVYMRNLREVGAVR